LLVVLVGGFCFVVFVFVVLLVVVVCMVFCVCCVIVVFVVIVVFYRFLFFAYSLLRSGDRYGGLGWVVMLGSVLGGGGDE